LIRHKKAEEPRRSHHEENRSASLFPTAKTFLLLFSSLAFVFASKPIKDRFAKLLPTGERLDI
jgi:hypothetical protein